MNITIINSRENLIKAEALGRYIVEYYADPENTGMVNIRIYDPDANKTWDVAPRLYKVDIIEVSNCIWNSQYLYFAAVVMTQEDMLEIGIYRYNAASRTCQRVCMFEMEPVILRNWNRIKVFVLSETAILVQAEVYHTVITGNMIGNIEFSLKLIRLDMEEEITVADSNFINNGINTITAVSDNKIMVKTGYSRIEDNRMDNGQESGAFIESVYVTTTSKFIADLTLASDTIDMPLIESAYRDRYITHPQVTGAYTHFSLISNEDYSAKCIFYNNESGERLEYNSGVLDPEDLDITYVINGQPYVRNTLANEINLLNLKKAEMDISFYDEVFTAQCGDVFVLNDNKSGSRIHVYTYPGLKRIINEKATFRDICMVGDDYYIYTS